MQTTNLGRSRSWGVNLPGAAPRGFSFWPPSPGSLDPFSVFQDGIRPAGEVEVGSWSWVVWERNEQVQIRLDQNLLAQLVVPGPGSDP